VGITSKYLDVDPGHCGFGCLPSAAALVSGTVTKASAPTMDAWRSVMKAETETNKIWRLEHLHGLHPSINPDTNCWTTGTGLPFV